MFQAAVVLILLAVVKIAGVEFVPKDLTFAAAEPRSRATADGALPNECKWNFSSETRIGKREDSQSCMRYYYKTSITLAQSCSAPNDKTPVTGRSERITADGPYCPDASGKVSPPKTEARALSSGTTAEGKQQDIILQPDGARITLLSDAAGVTAVIIYPDGTADTLKLP